MYIKVSEDIIKKVTQCSKKFSCLSAYRKDLCEIETQPSETLFIIKTLNNG